MNRTARWLAFSTLLLAGSGVQAQDWPQWRGPNRDGKATGFSAPATWPKELAKTWSVTVGDGVATPALVGDKLYVFALQEGKEIVRCLNASDGQVVWSDSYATDPIRGPDSRFGGPRSSPTVADGKVVTLGANGTLTCYDAASGKVAWRNEDFKNNVPRFHTSCSPIVVNGLCIVQLGGERNGALVAYDLVGGSEKWKWTDDGMAYASPVVANVGGEKAIVAETNKNIVAVSVAGGKLLWETPFAVTQGRSYNACTPIVHEQTIIYSGSGNGTKAAKLEKSGDKFDAKELWTNPEQSVQFNTPTVKDGLIYGLSSKDKLFCLNAESGKTAWTSDMRGAGGYGSIVDAGSVLLALTPKGELVAFEPSDKEFKQLANFKVASGQTYAYPVVSGQRIFIKDRDSVTLWTIP
jgi:outer membrane protein assembly factor BamB